jgi:hypothetical protein
VGLIVDSQRPEMIVSWTSGFFSNWVRQRLLRRFACASDGSNSTLFGPWISQVKNFVAEHSVND